MAVVGSCRIRGVTDGNTKSLFLLFTLLSLVCFASSLIDKDKLETLKVSVQKQQQKNGELQAEITAEQGIFLELMNAFLDWMNTEVEILKRAPPVFKPMLDAAERRQAEGVSKLQKFKLHMEQDYESMAARLKKDEMNLRKRERMITYLEETEAEL